MTFFGGFQFPIKVDTVSRKAKNKICRYNVSGSGTISLQELKIMMEKLGAPQTHLGLKAMIKEVSKMRRMRTRMSTWMRRTMSVGLWMTDIVWSHMGLFKALRKMRRIMRMILSYFERFIFSRICFSIDILDFGGSNNLMYCVFHHIYEQYQGKLFFLENLENWDSEDSPPPKWDKFPTFS